MQMQSNQVFYCLLIYLLNNWILQIISRDSKGPHETVGMNKMIRNYVSETVYHI